jgi:hypothetical protein
MPWEAAVQSKQIVTLLRTERDATELIKQDAGALTERLVQRSGPAGYRTEVITYLADLYAEVARMLALEHHLRITSNLEAASARSYWAVLRHTLETASNASDLSPELRATMDNVLAAIPSPPPLEVSDAESPSTAAPAAPHSC